MNNLTFYENLFQLRRKNSMTQKELSQILQVHITTVKKWEGGSCYPDAKNICALADIFHVTTDYLLGLESDRYDDESAIAGKVSRLDKYRYTLSSALCGFDYES